MNAWHGISGTPIARANTFGLMGIINVTPDSFYQRCYSTQEATYRAGQLLAEGADVLDIGAESTRPGAPAITQAEECRRLLPCVARIRESYPEALISVDTRNSGAARLALQLGCAIINDVSACRHDPELLDVLAEYKPGYVLMHAQGEPETMQLAPVYKEVVSEIKYFFEASLKRLICAGLPENRIALDPGIGFGKTLTHNLEILAHVEEFLQFGRPLLLGVSMKGMFANLLGLEQYRRGEATAVTAALLFAKGVIWQRAHEIGRVRRALIMAQALKS